MNTNIETTTRPDHQAPRERLPLLLYATLSALLPYAGAVVLLLAGQS